MEKRPSANQIRERYDEQLDDRYFRIILGIVCLTSVVLALLFMAAGAVGLIALIKFVFAL